MAGFTGPYAGSFIPMLRAVLDGARARGWLVEAVFPDVVRDRVWVEELASSGVTLRFWPHEPRLARLARVARLLDERPVPTILHTHFTSFDLAAALAGGRRRDVAVYWQIHTTLASRLGTRLQNLVKFGVVGREVAYILCVGPNIAEAVRRRGGPARTVRFLPNGIDTERFRVPSPAERATARRALGVGDGRAALLHFGHDWRPKGGDVFLGAVRRLLDLGRPVLGMTVGGGASAARARDAAGLRDAVRILPPRNDVRSLYAAADVFLAPARPEGMGLFSLAEALSSGLPVVASAIPGHVLLAGGSAASRLTSLDPSAVAWETARLLDRDADRAREDGEAGRAAIVARWDLSRWVGRLMALYEGTFAASGPT